MKIRPFLSLIAALSVMYGCKLHTKDGPVVVSVIGAETQLRDPARAAPRPADAALLGAVAQGLVRFEADGQIRPGLAIRWAISDDGLYYTFRLDRDVADAEKVAATLRRLFQRYRDSAIGTKLDAVSEVVAVTPEVIEIRLSAPRSDLLPLLAQPGFAMLLQGKGSGPLAIDGKVGRRTVLVAPKLPDIDGEAVAKPQPVWLRGERAALAIARFQSGEARLVIGGGFDDLPYVKLAGLPAEALQIDPVNGLFGFRIARTSAFLSAVENRQALSMAIDRDAIGDALGVPGWRQAQSILPAGLGDAAQPARPFWAQALANVRGGGRAQASAVDGARLIVRQWRDRQGGTIPTLRLAMPDGVGSAILFAAIRRQWAAIGVPVIRVRQRDAADLLLIDEVAPTDEADWYLRHFLCDRGPPCSEGADAAFTGAMATAVPTERAQMIRDAERQLIDTAPFIPIAQPVRWSLAAQGLPGFRANSRAIHPLPALINR